MSIELEEEPEFVIMPCPMCGAETDPRAPWFGEYWYKCRQCGWDWTGKP